MNGRKREGSVFERILTWLAAQPGGATTAEVLKGLKLEGTAASASLYQLWQLGEVTRCLVERDSGRPTYQYRIAAARGKPPLEAAKMYVPPPAPARRDASLPGVVIGKPHPRPEGTEAGAGGGTTAPAPQTPSSERNIEAPPSPTPGPVHVSPNVERAPTRSAFPLEMPMDGDGGAAPAPLPISDGSVPLRCALFSDGTLILENLPNCPPIVALPKDRTRELVDYLLCFRHQSDAEILKRRG